MPRHEEHRTVPFTQTQMYELVADVAKYPQFLPWCVGARVYDRREGELHADLLIGFKAFKERFTLRVTLDAPDQIHVDYIKGPMSHLHNDWRFADNGDGSCDVKFYVDFEFRNPVYQAAIGKLFTEAVHHMVMAFIKRAETLYS